MHEVGNEVVQAFQLSEGKLFIVDELVEVVLLVLLLLSLKEQLFFVGCNNIFNSLHVAQDHLREEGLEHLES